MELNGNSTYKITTVNRMVFYVICSDVELDVLLEKLGAWVVSCEMEIIGDDTIPPHNGDN